MKVIIDLCVLFIEHFIGHDNLMFEAEGWTDDAVIQNSEKFNDAG